MTKESDFQASLIKWLRQNGAFAWKMQQNATTRAGVSDILFLFLDSYGFIDNSKFYLMGIIDEKTDLNLKMHN